MVKHKHIYLLITYREIENTNQNHKQIFKHSKHSIHLRLFIYRSRCNCVLQLWLALTTVIYYRCRRGPLTVGGPGSFIEPAEPAIATPLHGSQNKNWERLSPQTALADKFLHVTIVPANAYQHTKFQLSSSISFGDRPMRGSQNKSGNSWFPQTPPSGQIFYTGR